MADGTKPQRTVSSAVSTGRRTRGRILVETALFSGLRISELLGLTWADIDFAAGLIRVRAQLSRAHRRATPFAAPTDWVFGDLTRQRPSGSGTSRGGC